LTDDAQVDQHKRSDVRCVSELSCAAAVFARWAAVDNAEVA
jgi:hypothetical protein